MISDASEFSKEKEGGGGWILRKEIYLKNVHLVSFQKILQMKIG